MFLIIIVLGYLNGIVATLILYKRKKKELLKSFRDVTLFGLLLGPLFVFILLIIRLIIKVLVLDAYVNTFELLWVVIAPFLVAVYLGVIYHVIFIALRKME